MMYTMMHGKIHRATVTEANLEYMGSITIDEDLMDAAGILPGDLVVVRQQQTCNQGEIVVAMIDDEATVKRFSRKNGHIWLLPENDDYEPIDGTYAQILGKVVAVVRQY